MKITKTEKVVAILIVIGVIAFFVGVTSIIKDIESAGGIKGIAISVGKDIKDIKERINEEDR